MEKEKKEYLDALNRQEVAEKVSLLKSLILLYMHFLFVGTKRLKTSI
jgi:hypothetical protein